MCNILNVSRSGFYQYLKRSESERTKRKKRLTKRIVQIFESSRKLYGSPKITRLLNRQGERVAQKTVASIMRENQLRSRIVRKYKATTNSSHDHPVHDNRLNQTFIAERPGQVYMSDITYVSTVEGWLYVASVMDLYSRKIVGWSAGDRMTKELVLRALDQAYARQRPKGSILHHSDRGSQYASVEYQKRLEKYNMVGSMSRKGNCYDNACIESFHNTLKRECVYLNKFQTRKAAHQTIFEYIEVFYNRQRIHSSIGYVSPHHYETMYEARAS